MVLFAPKHALIPCPSERVKKQKLVKCWRNLPRCGSFKEKIHLRLHKRVSYREYSLFFFCFFFHFHCRCWNIIRNWEKPIANAYGKQAQINQKTKASDNHKCERENTVFVKHELTSGLWFFFFFVLLSFNSFVHVMACLRAECITTKLKSNPCDRNDANGRETHNTRNERINWIICSQFKMTETN